jgi:hypothetical protein
MNDQMSELVPIRDHYDILCQRILGGESIPLIVAVLPQNGLNQMIPFSTFRIKGNYETTAAEGSKRIDVNEIVSISMLPPWKSSS